MWAGSARIFMAWRRSNLIKVPAPRQHLECESALAVWREREREKIRVSMRMRRTRTRGQERISPRFWLAERVYSGAWHTHTIVFAAWGFLYLDDEEFI